MKKLTILFLFVCSVAFGQTPTFINLQQLRFENIQGDNYPYQLESLLFFDSTGINNTSTKLAIDNFIVSLKSDGLWDSIKAVYPLVGDSTQQKYNLKDPSNYKIDWGQEVLHIGNGVVFNGNGWANTNLVPSTELTLNNTQFSMWLYSNDIRYTNLTFHGAREGSLAFGGRFNPAGGALWSYQYDFSGGLINTTNTLQSTGMMLSTRTASRHSVFINNHQLATNATTGGALPTIDYYFGAFNYGAKNYEYKTYGYYALGADIPDTLQDNYYRSVVELQQDLGRMNTNFVLDGNSITYGYQLGYGENYAAWVDTLYYNEYGNYLVPDVNALSGQLLTGMIADMSDIVYDYDTNYAKNVLVVMGGINDVGNSCTVSADSIYNRLVTYCRKADSIGYDVIAMTILPELSTIYYSCTNRADTINAINSLILNDAEIQNYTVDIIDLTGDTLIGCPTCPNDTIYYQTDKLHPTHEGAKVIGQYVYDALKSNNYIQ